VTAPLRKRVILFIVLLGGLVLVIGWAAGTAWFDLGALQRRFTTAQFESFRIAEQLQSSVLDLNSALLAYDRAGSPADWAQFEQRSRELNDWIDRQRDVLKTTGEKRVLADIDAEYDRYLNVANGMRADRERTQAPDEVRVRQLNAAAERMFGLASHLADAHRRALGDFLGESQRSLRRLEVLLCMGVVGVLASCGWGARVIFRDSIMPLRRQVVEAQTIAERLEKMASLGVLAAGVAHEIRNPLTAIKTRIFTLNRRLREDTEAREDTAIIESEILRLERIVNEFLLFARPAEPEFAEVRAEDLFREIVQLLGAELAENRISIEADGPTNGLTVRADPRQLKQVLINLVRNAAESIEQEGNIQLRAREDRVLLGGHQQNVVVLEVQDTGAGVPLAVRERLFDPFFTTKPTGTGLGLSIAMRILEKHGGTLQFETVPGQGSTFGIVLPR